VPAARWDLAGRRRPSAARELAGRPPGGSHPPWPVRTTDPRRNAERGRPPREGGLFSGLPPFRRPGATGRRLSPARREPVRGFLATRTRDGRSFLQVGGEADATSAGVGNASEEGDGLHGQHSPSRENAAHVLQMKCLPSLKRRIANTEPLETAGGNIFRNRKNNLPSFAQAAQGKTELLEAAEGTLRSLGIPDPSWWGFRTKESGGGEGICPPEPRRSTPSALAARLQAGALLKVALFLLLVGARSRFKSRRWGTLLRPDAAAKNRIVRSSGGQIFRNVKTGKNLVEEKGFEPSTPTLRTWCSPS
jgi:hypothetical protein